MERAELARLVSESLKRSGVGPLPAGDPAVPTVISERDPAGFMKAFAAAAGCPVFLADPSWGRNERDEFESLVRPEIRDPQSAIRQGWLCIPTGGTTGGVRLARHDARTIAAAVTGFRIHFSVEIVNAIGVLPLHRVGGLMAWMRCVLTGGVYRPWSWKELEAGGFPELPAGDCFLSLVPTQLRRLMTNDQAMEWLRRFRAVFVGAGPLDARLADAAASRRLPLSLTYGMTETAAMVAALQPVDFLSGGRTCGRALPHARLAIGDGGIITVAGDSLFRGYWPEDREQSPFRTGDLGSIDAEGRLRVLGRADQLIITGGRKVDASEVEEALMASGQFESVAVIGVPDSEWGEVVVACHPAYGNVPDMDRVSAALESIAAWKRPRRYVPVPEWPTDATGKIRRAELRARFSSH